MVVDITDIVAFGDSYQADATPYGDYKFVVSKNGDKEELMLVGDDLEISVPVLLDLVKEVKRGTVVKCLLKFETISGLLQINLYTVKGRLIAEVSVQVS